MNQVGSKILVVTDFPLLHQLEWVYLILLNSSIQQCSLHLVLGVVDQYNIGLECRGLED